MVHKLQQGNDAPRTIDHGVHECPGRNWASGGFVAPYTLSASSQQRLLFINAFLVSDLGAHVMVVIPETDYRPRQIVLITECTQACRA